MQFPFLTLGVKWKVVKGVHCPLLLMDTGQLSLSSCWQKLLQKESEFWTSNSSSTIMGKM